jgi:hypothetical protein
MSSIINADTSSGLTISSDNSGEIQFQSGGVTKAGINSTGWTGDASQLTNVGKVLQVVFNRSDAVTTYSGSTDHVIAELNTTFVPISATSKILINYNLCYEASYNHTFKPLLNNSVITTAGEESFNSVAGQVAWSGIAPAVYDANVDSTPQYLSFQYFHTAGSTASRYYGLLYASSTPAATIFKLNRAYNGAVSGQSNYEVGVSSVVITEINA